MKDNNCIFNLLKVIDLLQRNSTNHESFATGCDKPYLGPACTTICFNTRPISLYKKDGSLFSVNDYSVFRVEHVENNCVTLRALSGTNPNYTATEVFVTISPTCFCVIRCYPDTSITCL